MARRWNRFFSLRMEILQNFRKTNFNRMLEVYLNTFKKRSKKINKPTRPTKNQKETLGKINILQVLNLTA